jgi:hypothetical protein
LARRVLEASGMSNRILYLAIALASACAAHPQRPTSPVRYACGDATVVRTGEKLTVATATASLDDSLITNGPAQLGWTDGDGDHFVTWPHATTDIEALEYVVPHDEHKDALVKRYDASAGYSNSDWRLLDKRVCRAEGGYNDALSRWMKGDSLEKVAKDLSLEDRGTARTLVRKALAQLQTQYFNDR